MYTRQVKCMYTQQVKCMYKPDGDSVCDFVNSSIGSSFSIGQAAKADDVGMTMAATTGAEAPSAAGFSRASRRLLIY